MTLVAVSKMQPWEAIEPVLAAGQAVFGENRVQEAMSRWERKADGLTLHPPPPPLHPPPPPLSQPC